MIPCLYESTETKFNTNGIGKLADCISCYVTEKRNDSYELTMEYPSDGIHADELVENAIIYAQPAYDKDPQPFRIYKVTTPMDGKLEIEARHVSYQLSYITVSPTTVVSTTDQQPAEAFKALKANASVDCPFDFETDISSTAYFGILEPMSFRCALGGVDGSMLDTFGGEYEWDNYTVRLHKARGADNGVRIVYGKNLVDFTQEKNNEDVITGVHPYWTDSDTGDIYELPEKVVTLSNYDSPYQKIGLLDCTSQFDEVPTWDEMRAYAQSYLNDTTLTEPKVDIDIEFAQLWQMPGYEDIVEAEKVSLCDTVHVYITKLGIEVATKVTETEYDCLQEKYKSITLSNAATSSRNNSFALTVATTSQVHALIAMTDNSIRLSVSKRYATKDELGDTEIRLQSLIELTEEGILLEFSKYSTTSEVESMIKISEDGIAASYVKNGTVRSQFAMEGDTITVSSGTINFSSNSITISSTNFSVTAAGAITAKSGTVGGLTLSSSSMYSGMSSLDSTSSGVYIGTDGIALGGGAFKATKGGTITTESGNYKTDYSAGYIRIYYNSSQYGSLTPVYTSGTARYYSLLGNSSNCGALSIGIGSTGYLFVNNSQNPNGYSERVQAEGSLRITGATHHNNPIYIGSSNNVELYYGTYGSSAAIWDYNAFYAAGSIGCGGTKYRVVDTEHYGNIGMNAYETASAMFGDMGSGVVGEDGQVSIFFPDEFAEVIDMNSDYQVMLTRTSESKTEWVEKKSDHFVVHGEAGATFDWMISAHQRDYTMNRMETVTLEAEPYVEFDDSIFNTDNACEDAVNEMVDDFEREVATA